jgi:stage V sporulation protein G
VAHPINPEFRAELQNRILEKYDKGSGPDDPDMEI